MDKKTTNSFPDSQQKNIIKDVDNKLEDLYSLKDVMTCNLCGSKLAPQKLRNRRYYRCRGYNEGICSSSSVYAEDLENTVRNITIEIVKNFVVNAFPFTTIEKEKSLKHYYDEINFQYRIKIIENELKDFINKKRYLFKFIPEGYLEFSSHEFVDELGRNIDDIYEMINETDDFIHEMAMTLKFLKHNKNRYKELENINLIEILKSGSNSALKTVYKFINLYINYSIIDKDGLLSFDLINPTTYKFKLNSDFKKNAS